eukprot:391106-Pelagomonas_calceolata.AAC.7
MELIQNADDCKYNTSTPGLRFEVHADRILVKSNEVCGLRSCKYNTSTPCLCFEVHANRILVNEPLFIHLDILNLACSAADTACSRDQMRAIFFAGSSPELHCKLSAGLADVGFNKDNVKAICAMGQSPKANEQGYIGE